MNRTSGPRLVFFELTRRCNLKCVHCRAEAGESRVEGEMATADVKRVLDDIASFSSPIVVLTGGEPLYRDDIFEIARHAKDRGLRSALATNGTLIDEKTALEIKRAGFGRVSISIDGKDALSHDGFRGVPGSYRRALEGAGRLRDAGVDFQFNTTITKRNVGEIEEILRRAEEEGAVALHVFMLVPVGCGAEIAGADMLSGEEYEEVLRWFYRKTGETRMEFRATCAPHYYRIVRQEARREGRKLGFETDGMAAVTRGCLAGSGVCFISYRGDVQPCGYLPLSAGSVLERPFREIWETSDLFATLRDLDRLAGKCGRCEYRSYCAGCRARAYFACGDYMGEEPLCVYQPARPRRETVP